MQEMIPLRKENKEDDMEISQTENSAVNVSPEHQELELVSFVFGCPVFTPLPSAPVFVSQAPPTMSS